jgi:glycerol uptake facilitator-like aquaporin
MSAPISLRQRFFAEFLGTLILLCIVIGSSIMAERLSGGNVAVALLGNTFATVFGLYVLIEVFAPISNAHFNPAVSVVMALRGQMNMKTLGMYIVAQLIGAIDCRSCRHWRFNLGHT